MINCIMNWLQFPGFLQTSTLITGIKHILKWTPFPPTFRHLLRPSQGTKCYFWFCGKLRNDFFLVLKSPSRPHLTCVQSNGPEACRGPEAGCGPERGLLRAVAGRRAGVWRALVNTHKRPVGEPKNWTWDLLHASQPFSRPGQESANRSTCPRQRERKSPLWVRAPTQAFRLDASPLSDLIFWALLNAVIESENSFRPPLDSRSPLKREHIQA